MIIATPGLAVAAPMPPHSSAMRAPPIAAAFGYIMTAFSGSGLRSRSSMDHLPF